MIRRFLRDERGTTAIEYAVIAALIFMAIILAIQPVGAALALIFGDAATGMTGAAAAP